MKRALTTLFIALAAASVAHAVDFSAWGKRMEIAFPGYSAGSDILTNFPTLVILTEGSNLVDFTDFETGGADLRFTADDQSTELNYEIETWDDATSNSYVWVQVPLLTNDATIYAYWNKTGETAPNYTTNGAAWGSGYVGVWHMAEPSTPDATAGAHDCTANDNVDAEGVIGVSQYFDGTTAYASATGMPMLTTAFTFSAWVKADASQSGAYPTPLNYWSSSWGLILEYYNNIDLRVYNTDDWGWGSSSGVVFDNGNWQHIAFIWDKSTGLVKTHNNGAVATWLTGKTTTLSSAGPNATVRIGARQDGQYFKGPMDEVRVSHVARSDDWIWASWLTAVSNRQFTTYADAMSPDPNRPQITIQPATNVTATSACLNGYLSSTGTSSTTVFVHWGETDEGTNATQWAHTNTFTTPQSVGPLTTNVTLQTGKEYFYRYAASNDSRQVWAETSEYLLTAGITVSVNPDTIGENSDTATFSFARGQSVTGNAVTVYYEIGGNAGNGTDYESLTEDNITIAAGDTNATVPITSIFDYHVNGDEELELTVLGDRNYVVDTPSNAVLTITNEILPSLTIESATSGLWNEGTTWVGDVVPSGADDVVITNGCTVTIHDNTSIIIQSLTIETNGVLTHSANGTTGDGELYKVVMDIVNDLTVDLGGKINVDNKGYNASGPGFVGSYAGSSHGGKGTSLGATYGSITSPTTLGSGSRYAVECGGGAAQLLVAGTTAVNGIISASDMGANAYGSSGGSVFLTTGTLIGNGTIRANSRKKGGGGRVAVILTSSADFGEIGMEAYGGPNGGAGGTVYLETTNHTSGHGKLIVDYNNESVANPITISTLQNGLEASSYEFSEIVLTNGAVYALDANDTLIITNTVIHGTSANRKQGIYVAGGTLTVPAAFGFTNYYIAIGNTNSIFAPTASLTVGTNATMKFDAPWTVDYPIILEAGGWLSHSANGSTEAYKLNLTINADLNIQTGGQVNVDNTGYNASGPGFVSSYVGSSYGGQGSGKGLTYGSITSPTNCGSGSKEALERGGGSAQLTVTGTTTVYGVISSSDMGANAYGSSGGSVFLTTGTLIGNGTIRANSRKKGGGGRIAVILTNSTDFGTIGMQAYGGPNGGAAGTIYTEIPAQGAGNGTLLIDAYNRVATVTTLISANVTDTTVGTVIITNQAKFKIATDQSLTVNGDWLNTATFIGTNAGATVTFASTNTATVNGHNPFYNLVCTNVDKVIVFEDGKTNTVDGTLTLADVALDSTSGSASWYLKASSSTHSVSNVTVGRSDARSGATIEAYDSTNLGGNYKWVFAESGFWSNTWTGATDSDWNNTNNWSRNRTTVFTDTVAIPTNNYGNYPLLDFDKRMLSLSISNGASMSLNGYDLTVDADTQVAGTLTATAAETLTFGGDLDFSGGGAFSPASSTVLLSGTNAQSVVSDGNTFYQLTISERTGLVTLADAVEATNFLNQSSPVTFVGSVTAASSFRTQGTNVTFCGAVTATDFHNTDGALVFSDTLTATSFYSANGALVFSGTVAAVTFTNWQADLTFHDDVSSDAFYCAPGGMDLTFEAGKTNTIGNLELYGSGDNLIRLRSSAASSWLLNVTNSADVRHVDVQYSDANAGETIYPLASTDSGNNPNWDFGNLYQTWVGTNSAVFTDGDNWAPAGVPDTSSRVLIDGYYVNAPILSGMATVTEVIVGGSVTTATLTVNGNLTTLGDLDVQTKGMITHTGNAASEANKLYLTVGSNLTVSAGGQINVDNKGYYACGPGYVGSYTGSSYGGQGTGNGPTYGSITSPTNCGSGSREPLERGGGSAQLVVAGTTTVYGVISASDMGGNPRGSSGGSVFLTTGTLTGNGTIRANGRKGGGGGRVAVYLTNSANFSGVGMVAYGGPNSGAAGTVYTETTAQGAGNGTLLIDASNRVATVTTLISSSVTDTTVGTVVITNQAILKIAANQSLTANGSWLNTATFIGTDAGATVTLAGAGDATVQGNNAFYNLTAGAAGKTIRFEAGKTTTVNGKLTFVDDTTLLSTLDGTQWGLDLVDPGGTQEVGRVTVKDSDADPGQEILAGQSSTDLGNNVNWVFSASGSLFKFR